MHFLTILSLLTFLKYCSCTCHSTGCDYADGGTYFVDNSSDYFFSFGTIFTGTHELSRTHGFADNL